MNLTDKKYFDEKISSNELVIIDFYAPWCGPCKMLTPVIDQLAESHKELNIIKVNIDEFPEISEEYKILTVPTIVFVKNQKEVDRHNGFIPADQILEKVSKL